MDKFKLAQIHGKFVNEMASVRDMLRPVVDGEIERGHCVGTRECYGGKPGKRKTTLKDAREIAKTIVFRIDKAINEFDKATENL